MYERHFPLPAERALQAGVIFSALIILAGGAVNVSSAQSPGVIVDESVLDQLGPAPQSLPRAITRRTEPARPAPIPQLAPSVSRRSFETLPHTRTSVLLPPPATMPKSRLLVPAIRPTTPSKGRSHGKRTPSPRGAAVTVSPGVPPVAAPRIPPSREMSAKAPAPKVVAKAEQSVPSAPTVAPAPPKIVELATTSPSPRRPSAKASKPDKPAVQPRPGLSAAKPVTLKSETATIVAPTPPPAAPDIAMPGAAIPKGEAPKVAANTENRKPNRALAAGRRKPKTTYSTASKSKASAKKSQLASLAPAKTPSATLSENGNLVRIPFAPESSEIPENSKIFLDALAKRVDADPDLQIQLTGYASAADGSASKARRLSLFRALSVRTYLMKKGIFTSRMIVRALGSQQDGGNPERVDARVKK